jgi:hypothetical protein
MHTHVLAYLNQQMSFVIHMTHINSEVPSSGSYYNKRLQANLPVHVLFVLVSVIKALDC